MITEGGGNIATGASGMRHNPPPRLIPTARGGKPTETGFMDFTIDIREQDGLRTMRFESSCVQGAMQVLQPWQLALEYTRAMMAALLLFEDGLPQRVLLIGLGAGSMVKFLYRHCPQAHLTAVEIEPRVVAAAREHFGLPDDPVRLTIVVGDGAAFVRESGETYDLILVDGFNQHAHPGELNTRLFYQACRERLRAQGVLAVNLIGLSHRYTGGFVHIEAAFEGRAMLLPKCCSGNTIAIAAVDLGPTQILQKLKSEAGELERRTGLELSPMISRLG